MIAPNGKTSHVQSDGLYFSVITCTTLGYGDLVPVGWSRRAASVEALTQYVVMALLIAALIALMQWHNDDR